jgi:hypothetical protein
MGQLFLKNLLDYEQHQKHILKIFVTDGYQVKMVFQTVDNQAFVRE